MSLYPVTGNELKFNKLNKCRGYYEQYRIDVFEPSGFGDWLGNEKFLTSLYDRRENITKKLGQEPDNFSDFQAKNPMEPPHIFRNIGYRSVAGNRPGGSGLLIAGVSLVASAGLAILLIGGVLGASIGSMSEMPNAHRSKAIKEYEKYLDDFEKSASKDITRQPAQTPDYSADPSAVPATAATSGKRSEALIKYSRL